MDLKNKIVLACVAALALLSGYLISTISFTGRVGISLFYHQYRFLKAWWKDAFLVFAVWMIIWVMQMMLRKKISKSISAKIHFAFMLTAAAGLCFSYADFRHTLSHRWLGEPFHAGIYLFWIGWMALTIFEWLQPHNASAAKENEALMNAQP